MDRQGSLDQSVRLGRRVVMAVLATAAWLFVPLATSGQDQKPPPQPPQAAPAQPPAAAAAPAPAKTTAAAAANSAPAAASKQPAAAPAAPPPQSAAASAAATEPLERRPYRISVHVGTDPSARIDDAKRAT